MLWHLPVVTKVRGPVTASLLIVNKAKLVRVILPNRELNVLINVVNVVMIPLFN